MDRDFLVDLFAPFGAVAIKRMFSGYAVSADEVTFALVIRDSLYFRVDEANLASFEAEGSQPFQYTTKARAVTVKSYWRLPDRLLDDPDELADWARAALGAARRAALAKASKPRRETPKKKPAKTKLAKTSTAKQKSARPAKKAAKRSKTKGR